MSDGIQYRPLTAVERIVGFFQCLWVGLCFDKERRANDVRDIQRGQVRNISVRPAPDIWPEIKLWFAKAYEEQKLATHRDVDSDGAQPESVKRTATFEGEGI